MTYKIFKSITFSIIIFQLVLISGCSEDDVKERCNFTNPTYSFTEEQEEKSISYNYFEGQIIQYRNNNNVILNFEVTEVDNCARGYYPISGPGFFLSSGNNRKPQHTFDSQVIKMTLLEHDTNSHTYREQMHYYVNKSHSSFKQSLNFPLWNVSINGFGLSGSQNPANLFLRENEFTEVGMFQVNNMHFNKVVKFDSGSNQVRNSSSTTSNLLHNINVIYYDQNFGVIRFDEIDGTIWEVIYPE